MIDAQFTEKGGKTWRYQSKNFVSLFFNFYTVKTLEM